MSVLCAVLAMVSALSGLQTSASPRVALMVDPPVGEVGLVMDLRLSISGEQAADCNLIEIPTLDGGRLRMVQSAAQSRSTVFVQGRITTTLRTEWRFQLVPEREGTLVIPPFRFDCRGASVASREIEVQVGASTLLFGAVDLQLFVSSDDLWVGQLFSVDVVASIDEEYFGKLLSGGVELHLPWLEGLSGMLRLKQGPPSGQLSNIPLSGRRRESLEMRIVRDSSGERPRIVFSRSVQMIATQAGEIVLPESRFSVTIAMESRPNRDPFGGFFSRDTMVVTRAVAVDALAPSMSLVVLGPPEEGRPRAFTNAMGQFRFSGSANPTTLSVGETCTITLSLIGEGNLDFIDWPAFDELAKDFRVFGKNERKLTGVRVLELAVSPRNDRVTEIPALEFAAFDPELDKYQVLSAGPFALDVSSGGSGGLVTLDSPSETLSSLETIREALPAPNGHPPSGWMLLLPGVLALLCVEVGMRRAAWRRGNAHLVAARGARRSLAQALDAAQDVHDIATAFSKYLSMRLHGPPAGLGAEEAAARLSDAELAEELRRVVSGWEAGYLGGAELDLRVTREQAEALAARVEAVT